MHFDFATADEIAQVLCGRLKAARLGLGLAQSELAVRAGVSRRTILNLENHGQCTLGSFVRVVQALGLERDLHDVFQRKAQSIAELEERNAHSTRKRAPRKPGAGAT